LLPGKSDVSVALRAARYLYARLLRAGLEIYEYQPQILHTKLYVFDHAVYAGSSNLDTRSLRLNHELMLRLTDPGLVKQAAEAFDGWLGNARRIEAESWKSSR
jgi:cardiolipin synthase